MLTVTTALVLAALTLPQQRSLDRTFVCPEKLADDAARLTTITRYMDDYARLDPAATVNDRLAYRDKLLAKHHCAPDGDKAQYTFPQT
ncbi:hypothetical protein KZX46_09350 [Polymorphobacter sp. PAMC 29334]|uniref:hypothetical protein n=1 Tax=Polymorphobacter sp. PAMC 29334 TaxID=2862331 RepID=UPI001C77C6FF|nr:hypothetical protein [Polymorphobacter sp. PAMC 29334]QYE36113.1 hypothetical protein KZX46_09350 [Polymorphobacter sp. PAMC 29334]